MEVQCPSCKKKLTLFASQVKQKECRIKCIGCGFVIKVAPGKTKLSIAQFNRL
ncbi:hypothetical protein [Anaerospora hongkongensis]|uniref:hypothetical protein n=1 Tax=Anaerospora hongkongensis TaxID=244830 RepID=UPI002896664C|nr:hypothetical protein [Anaerospora hongkongensis]